MDEKNLKQTALWVGIAIIVLWLITLLILIRLPNEVRGTFGDMFGSINALFSGLALAGIIITILMQRNELQLQRMELSETREEFKTQNKTLKYQRVDNTFFNLLKNHNEIVGLIKLQEQVGREAFQWLYHQMKPAIENASDREKINPAITTLEITLAGYDKLYKHYEHILGHYFRNLYQIVKFIDQSNVEDKNQYTTIIRAQLTSFEQVLLFYNCLSDYGVKNFKPLVEKYSLLKGLRDNYIYNFYHLQFYNSSAFGKTGNKI